MTIEIWKLKDTEITILTDTDKPVIIFLSWPVTDKSKIVKLYVYSK